MTNRIKSLAWKKKLSSLLSKQGYKSRKDWIKFLKNTGEPISMTRTQSEFADFLFKHQGELKNIGDVSGVFHSVYSFIKHEEVILKAKKPV